MMVQSRQTRTSKQWQESPVPSPNDCLHWLIPLDMSCTFLVCSSSLQQCLDLLKAAILTINEVWNDGISVVDLAGWPG